MLVLLYRVIFIRFNLKYRTILFSKDLGSDSTSAQKRCSQYWWGGECKCTILGGPGGTQGGTGG